MAVLLTVSQMLFGLFCLLFLRTRKEAFLSVGPDIIVSPSLVVEKWRLISISEHVVKSIVFQA